MSVIILPGLLLYLFESRPLLLEKIAVHLSIPYLDVIVDAEYGDFPPDFRSSDEYVRDKHPALGIEFEQARIGVEQPVERQFLLDRNMIAAPMRREVVEPYVAQ